MNSDCTMERCLFMNPNPDKCDVINCQWKTTNIFNAIKQAYDDGYSAGKRDKSITSNSWISVDDALPTKTGDYLVAVCEPIGEEGKTTSFVLNAWYNAETFPYSHDFGWTLLNEFYEFTRRIRERITHWMPLPKPPEVTR